MSCAGVTLRGFRRGEPCGSPGQYAYRGKMYCAQHRTIAAASPGEFKLAQAALFKRLGKEAYKAMQAKAQLDAFPERHDYCSLHDHLEPDGHCQCPTRKGVNRG